MGQYKVVYHYAGCEWVFGYADTLGEAIEMESRCDDNGWFVHWIMKWDDATGRWVRAN